MCSRWLHSLVVCCVLLAVLLAAAVAGAAPLVVTYDFAAPTVVRQAGGVDRVEMPGLSLEGQPGAPLLPYRTCSILLPAGSEVAGVAITGSDWLALRGVYTVEHRGQPMPISKGRGVVHSPRDEAIYASTEWLPAQPWTRWSVQRWRGHAMLVLGLAPVRYLPAAGRLQWRARMTVTITLRPAGPPVARVSTAPRDLDVLRRHVDNPEAVHDLAATGSRPAASPLLDPGTPYEYVVITSAAFAGLTGTNSLQDFVAWKAAGGTTATMVTTEWIYANYSGTRPDGGSDNQTRLRNFIIDAYNTWGTEYVLLAGDADGADVGGESGDNIVPCRGLSVNAGFVEGNDDNIPSDLYYACLDGSYDSDADGRYGEPNDGPGGDDVDLLPEVHVGRAAVDSESEVRDFVAKTLAYASAVPPREVLMVGEYVGFGGVGDWGGNYKDEIKNGSSNYGFTTVGFLNAPVSSSYDVSTLYDRDYPGNNWPVSALIDRINAGLHIINHLGHANTVYAMKFDIATADALGNTAYFIGYSQGCYAGAFDDRDADPGRAYLPQDSIVEHFTLGPAGAVAFIANSRYGWGYADSTDGPSQRFDREFWDAVLGESIVEIGGANDDSKWDLVGYIQSDLIGRWCAYEANLLGDPQLRIRVGLSSAGLVSLDQSVYGLTDSVTITVLDVDLDTNPAAADTVSVTIASTTETTPENVLCTETGVSTGTFEGGISLAPGAPAADGVLQVSDGDTITVTYLDADDGSGGTNLLRTDTATVDGQPPVFSGLGSAVPGDGYVDLQWSPASDPSQPVRYRIYRGETPGGEDFGSPLAVTAETSYRDTAVTAWSPYYYVVRAEDAVGNVDSNTIERSATPVQLAVVYNFPLNSNPGWTAGGGWEFGTADQCGGLFPAYCSAPLGGWGPHSGSYLYGHRLTGSTSPLPGAESLTTTAIDCTGLQYVTLSFWRRLGVSPFTAAAVKVSNNGSTWTTVWASDGRIADDLDWVLCSYDISAVADDGPTVYIRWSIGPTSDNSCYCWGFDIDDVQIKALAVASPPQADFSASPTSGPAPLAVTFTDLSTNTPTSWNWDFGDSATSTGQNPSHTYNMIGRFTVSLTAANDAGPDTEIKPDYITVVPPPPVAAFSASVTSGVVPLTVTFTDQSTGVIDSWEWDFGDGIKSFDQNPTHQYAAVGTYTVSLKVSNAGGSDTETKVGYIAVLLPPPVAAFSGTPTSGIVPLDVTFTDQSTGVVTAWAWNFGDAGTSVVQHPIHQYTAMGTYTVVLTVSNADGADTETKSDYISALAPPPPPVAGFSATPTAGTPPLNVAFTDASTGVVESWAWDFGDSGTSAEQNPTHEYTTVGSYTVSLEVTNISGSDTETKTGCIQVVWPITADFSATGRAGTAPLEVSFSNLSTGAPTLWLWDFGDETSSTEPSPVHTYTKPGYYTVTLTGSNAGATDTETKVGFIAAGFIDTPPESSAFYEILACVKAGVVQGYSDGRYQPEREVNRGQMAIYIARVVAGGDILVPEPAAGTQTFPDVDSGNLAYYKYVEYCADQHIVQGFWDGSYKPDKAVNRGQMAMYIARGLVAPGGDAAVLPATGGPTFPDVTVDGTWGQCFNHVEYIAGLGVVHGYQDGNYHPERTVRRSQMAQYVQRAFELPTYPQ